MDLVTSADGTTLAYEALGDGRPVILAAGALCDRSVLRPLATALAAGGLRAVTYDRRGRGDSTDTSPYAVEREIDDLAALVAAVGGSACLYGHSSGAGLALEAVAAGLPFDRVVLHEPPYADDTPEDKGEAREFGDRVCGLLADGRNADALVAWLGDQMPAEAIAEMLKDPRYERLAPTLANDLAVMGTDSRGSVVPVELVRKIVQPTLVLYGSASPEFFAVAAKQIAAELPDGRLEVLVGEHHGALADVVAPYVLRFLA